MTLSINSRRDAAHKLRTKISVENRYCAYTKLYQVESRFTQSTKHKTQNTKHKAGNTCKQNKSRWRRHRPDSLWRWGILQWPGQFLCHIYVTSCILCHTYIYIVTHIYILSHYCHIVILSYVPYLRATLYTSHLVGISCILCGYSFDGGGGQDESQGN